MNEKQSVWDDIRAGENEGKLLEKVQGFACEYMNTVNERPVFPSDKTRAQLSVFDEAFPEQPGNPDRIIEMLHEYGSPATVAQTGNRYFGFVNGGITPAGLAAKWLADVWDQNAGLYVISPVAAALEAVCEKWLVELFGLPGQTVAGFVSGTSTATMCGLLAARNYLLERAGWPVRKKGLFNAPRIKVVLGDQAHSTVFKALSTIGFGMDELHRVPVDSQGRMIAEQLPKLDEQTLVIAQAGNVSTGAFDPFDDICDPARKAGAWVHIDGAFGLWAAGSEQTRYLVRGIEKADSWSVDAHKTLNAPYDNGIVLCRDENALVSALQNTGSYIQYSSNRDGMMYTMDMSRRARGPELWATLKYFGKQGVQILINDLVRKAQEFARQLAQNGFTILNDVVFNQVLVCCETDEVTTRTLENIQKGGVFWCGGAQFDDRAVIRISVCSWATTDADIKTCVNAFVTAHRTAQEK